MLDLKIAKIESEELGACHVVLACSESSLYQFVGRDQQLKSLFTDYENNKRLVEEHSINIDAKGNHFDDDGESQD